MLNCELVVVDMFELARKKKKKKRKRRSQCQGVSCRGAMRLEWLRMQIVGSRSRNIIRPVQDEEGFMEGRVLARGMGVRHFIFPLYRLKLLLKPRSLELRHYSDVTGRYLQFALLNWSGSELRGRHL
jgi:hypothetical protein